MVLWLGKQAFSATFKGIKTSIFRTVRYVAVQSRFVRKFGIQVPPVPNPPSGSLSIVYELGFREGVEGVEWSVLTVRLLDSEESL